MTRIVSPLFALALLCPVDLDAGVPEAGVPTANVRHVTEVLHETRETAAEIQAIIKQIKTLYGVSK